MLSSKENSIVSICETNLTLDISSYKYIQAEAIYMENVAKTWQKYSKYTTNNIGSIYDIYVDSMLGLKLYLKLVM